MITKNSAFLAKEKVVGFVDHGEDGEGMAELTEVEPRPEEDVHDASKETSLWSGASNVP